MDSGFLRPLVSPDTTSLHHTVPREGFEPSRGINRGRSQSVYVFRFRHLGMTISPDEIPRPVRAYCSIDASNNAAVMVTSQRNFCELLQPYGPPKTRKGQGSLRMTVAAAVTLTAAKGLTPTGPVSLQLGDSAAYAGGSFRSNFSRRRSRLRCTRAIVRSPRVRSRMPRTASVVRRRPPVIASG